MQKLRNPGPAVKVALVGKYVQLNDAYLSVVEALRHACIHCDSALDLHWICAEQIEEERADGLLKAWTRWWCPAVWQSWRRRQDRGHPLGPRTARAVPGALPGHANSGDRVGPQHRRTAGATSAELDPASSHPVIHLLPEQQDVVDLGGTMRLGVYPCRLAPGTKAHELYGEEVVYERHRHRYEFNNAYRNLFLESGYEISGVSPDGRLVELIELKATPTSWPASTTPNSSRGRAGPSAVHRLDPSR